MATRYFENGNLAESAESLLFSTMLMIGYTAPLRLVRVPEEDRAQVGASRNEQALADVQALKRGVRWAFAIEGGAALLAYAAWCLWRLVL
jgi:hypothetical protein